jgi:hypothetical protein
VPNAPSPESLRFKLAFLRSLKAHVDSLVAAGNEVIPCGDMNIASTSKDVHPCYSVDKMYSAEEHNFILSMSENLVDVWRTLHPDATDVYTCWDEKTSARAFNQGLRIDYIFATPRLAARVTSCEVLGAEDISVKWSDHAGERLSWGVLSIASISHNLHTYFLHFLVVELDGVERPSAAERPLPAPEWAKLRGRFYDKGQRTLFDMMGPPKKRLKEQPDAANDP